LTLFTEQVNAGKGRLRTILHRSLYNPIEELLAGGFTAKRARLLFAYEEALLNTKAWRRVARRALSLCWTAWETSRTSTLKAQMTMTQTAATSIGRIPSGTRSASRLHTSMGYV